MRAISAHSRRGKGEMDARDQFIRPQVRRGLISQLQGRFLARNGAGTVLLEQHCVVAATHARKMKRGALGSLFAMYLLEKKEMG
uniref:Uncharacterized protein n=1 Tax=Solanum tuberosum TaxID=4113 RepID=M1DJG7_SOLTU